MPRPSQPIRLLLAVGVALAVSALALTLLSATDAAFAVWERLDRMPALLRWGFLAALGVLGIGGGWLVWRLLRPGRGRAPRAEPIDRAALEARAGALGEAGDRARGELLELERRRAEQRVQVALFGEISAGKSSLMRALAPDSRALVAVTGGTTRAVERAEGRLPDGSVLMLADVPGSNEVGGEQAARLAREEAARAHAIVFVTDGEPTREQDRELRALAAFDRPLLLALNKSDRYTEAQLDTLLARLRDRYGEFDAEVVAVRAGGEERVLRRLADGSEREEARPAAPRVDALVAALARIVRRGPEALEPGREAATLAAVEQQLSAAERAERAQRSEAVVGRYTRRAVVGALAAVAPGTDLVIQGALATAMTRELAAIHGLAVREVDVDAFLSNAGGLLRTTASVTLAVAGNALKAFPGLGTLGGGLLHAVAYGLIFDSLGRALATTMAETRALDREAALEAFRERLASPGEARLRAVAELAWQAWRERSGDAGRPK